MTRSHAHPVFPRPDHDHARCSADAMAEAEAKCFAHGQRLTPIRRQVLEVLAAQHRPLGAYEIMEVMGAGGKQPAPITVYRALEFLQENGLVHRIESRNAFVACIHNHGSADTVVFMICDHCGAVGEAPAASIMTSIGKAAKAVGFTPKTPVIEIPGTCAHCRTSR